MISKFSISNTFVLRVGVATVALSASFSISSQVRAQEDPAQVSTADEIVVTARSQGETLLEVPVAVTAFGGAQLAKMGVADLTKVAQMAPQLEIYSGGAGSGASLLIRGVGTTADTAGVDQSVSLALDKAQIAPPRTVYGGLFDLKQVAVLKGPQALFFGRNATAGVVSIESAEPTPELSGYVRGGYEIKARERYFEAAVSIPITEALGVRFAGRYSKLRGWVKNIADGVTIDPFNPFESVAIPGAAHRWGPGSENMGGRITLKWDPGSNYTSLMKAMFLGYKDSGATSTAEPVCEGLPTTYGVWDGISDCKLNGLTAQGQLPPTYAEGPVGDRRWFSGVPYTDMTASLLTWYQRLDLGNIALTANTAYSRNKFKTRGNYSGTEFVNSHGGVDEAYKGFSQEVRLITDFDDPFNFTVGAYYERTKGTQNSPLFLNNAGRDPDSGSYQAGYHESWFSGTTWSGFGQARFEITPELELAGGVRYTHVSKRARQGQPTFVNQLFDPNFTPTTSSTGYLLPEGVLLRSSLKEDNWSPEATLTWHPTSDQTLYLAYKTGYKSGGIGVPAIVVIGTTGENLVFNDEKAKGGEIGYKARLLDRRLTFEATAYYYKFSGLQLTSFDPLSFSYRIQNAADAKQHGLEASASYQVADGFTISIAGAYNHLDYGKFTNSACWANQTPAQGCVGGVQDLSGKKLHRAPRISSTVSFNYDTPIGGDLMLGLSGDGKYSGSYFTSETHSPSSKQREYVLLNAAVRVYRDDDSWELALIGRNLTNKRIIGFYQDRSNAVTSGVNEGFAYGQRPREVAVQGTLRF